MPLKDILGGREEINEEQFLEVCEEGGPRLDAISIQIANVNDYGDVDSIQKSVREGNIVFAKIKVLKEKDISELKRAIERLRKTVAAINGDIAGISEDYIVVTPSFARVDRTNAEVI